MRKYKRGGSLELSGSGSLKLSGSGLSSAKMGYGKMLGEGWRQSIGATLMAVSGVTGLGAMKEKNVNQGIGSAVLAAVGASMIAAEKIRKKKGKGGRLLKDIDQILHQHVKKFLKVNPHHAGGALRLAGHGNYGHGDYDGGALRLAGQGITDSHVRDFLQKHKNKKIGIKDIFPTNWKQKGNQMMKAYMLAIKHQSKEMGGSGIFDDIGKTVSKGLSKAGKTAKTVVHKAVSKMQDFAAGKTSFKPSTYMDIAGTILNLEGKVGESIGIPGAQYLGSYAQKGLTAYGQELREAGRGKKKKKKIPKYMLDFARKHPAALKAMEKLKKQKGGALAVMDTIKALSMLYSGFMKAWKWWSDSGITMTEVKDAAYRSHKRQAGYGAYSPLKALEIYPTAAKKLVKFLKNPFGMGYMQGGKITKKKLMAILGIGAAAAGTALYAAYKHVQANPQLLSGLEAKYHGARLPVSQLAEQEFVGLGDEYSGGAYPGQYISTGAKRLLTDVSRQSGTDLSKKNLALRIGVPLTGLAIASAYALYKKLRKKKKGGAMDYKGSGLLPLKHLKWIKKYPKHATKVLKLFQSKKGYGYDSQVGGKITLKKIAVALGITSAGAVAAGGLALLNHLTKKPEHASDRAFAELDPDWWRSEEKESEMVTPGMGSGIVKKYTKAMVEKYKAKNPKMYAKIKKVANKIKKQKQIGGSKFIEEFGPFLAMAAIPVSLVTAGVLAYLVSELGGGQMSDQYKINQAKDAILLNKSLLREPDLGSYQKEQYEQEIVRNESLIAQLQGSGIALAGSAYHSGSGLDAMTNFIHAHPEKALLLMHYIHKRKKGGAQYGGGFMDFIKDVGKVGKKVVGKVYKGAEIAYDYTNGLPLRAVEGLAKEVFKVDLNKFATYRDAKKVYSYATGDPRKFKDMFEAATHPEKTFKTLKKYSQSAIAGFSTGGPAGLVRSVGKQRFEEDIEADIKTFREKGFKGFKVGGGAISQKIINKLQKNPQASKMLLQKLKQHGGYMKGSGYKSFLKKAGIATAIGAATMGGVYAFFKKNPELINRALDQVIKSGHTYLESEGSGKKMPYGVKMMGNGKIKRDRYSTYHGYYPSTKSGLTKKDFLLKGKKVISRKKSEMGKRMMAEGRGIYANK